MAIEEKNGSSLNNVTRICPNTQIIGNIITQHDIRVDGEIDGEIKTEGKLVIGESGKCKGKVQCKNVDISGSFDGVLTISELASLRDKCVFVGELHTDQLSIEPTVRISCQIISQELSGHKDEKKPLGAPAAQNGATTPPVPGSNNR